MPTNKTKANIENIKYLFRQTNLHWKVVSKGELKKDQNNLT